MKILIYYYGILQAFHLVMNFFVIFGDTEKYLGMLTDKADSLLMTSAYLDFFAASPLGVLFVIGFLMKKHWAHEVGLTSLSLAMISAVIYEYALISNGVWEMSGVNLVFTIVFAPVVLLFVLVLTKGRSFAQYI